MDAPGIPDGPISLPTGATLVSDADEEIFLLYTRLASLKPPDSSDMGHFHGLGSENSKEDALLVRIELQSPPPPPPSTATTDELSPAPRYEKRNAGRRNTGKKKREAPSGSSGRQDLGPVVLEYRLFQDVTALRSRSGDTGSVLWKTRYFFFYISIIDPEFNSPRSKANSHQL